MENVKLIRITKNRVFLSPDISLSLSETSLKGADISFRTAQDIYLKIEIIYYNKNDHSIEVRVTDYNPRNTEAFKHQQVKYQVSLITFKPFIWKHIERHLASYTRSKLVKAGVIFDDGSASPIAIDNTYSRARSTNSPNVQQPKAREPVIETMTETGKIYYKEADFNLGFVSFHYHSARLNEDFHIRIDNTFLLPEFNAVKSYFPKALGGKKQFLISVAFTLTDNSVTGIFATSPEIQAIDQTIIDSIKRERIANLTSIPLSKSVNKSLFTAADIFEHFSENVKDGNIFNQSEQEVLNTLIETSNIRNAKHLQYLSGSKHSPKQKLRFTLNPLFGFLFFIEGKSNNHFCWELLNSHATYLWTFDKGEQDPARQFEIIEQTINTIRQGGRQNYKTNYKNDEVDTDLSFCTIEHSNITEGFEQGFALWKNKLNEQLI